MGIHGLFLQLKKVDPIKGIVTGVAACEEPDKTGEIFDYATSKPFFEQWSGEISKATDGKSVGNVRAMHGKVAAGKLTGIVFDDPGKTIEVTAKIVDENELKKLSEGVYTGFSIGGDYEKKWKDGDLVRYTAKPNEISIVDNPCMPSAHFSVVKEDGTAEMRKFAPAPAPAPELEQVWRAKDGKTFAKKSEAEAHNVALAKTASDPAAQLTAAVAGLAAQVAKAENSYGVADAAADASEEVLEMKDITDIPEVVRAAMADSKTAEVFRVAYNKARSAGMGPVEAIDDAWGKVVEGSTKTVDGKYTITGKLDEFVEDTAGVDVGQYGAGIKMTRSALDNPHLSDGAKAQLEGLLARNAAGAPAAKREFTQGERDKAEASGAAMPGGRYPINSTKDLQNAIQSYGRAKGKAEVKAHIKTRAKALGAEDKLPDSWKDGADKALVLDELMKGLLYGGKRLTKGLYEVCDLAQIIMSLEYLQERLEMEAAREGDNSKVPANLKQDIASICACLREMVEEETNELLSDQEQLDFGEMLEMAAGVKGSNALSKVSASLNQLKVSDLAKRVLVELRKAHSKAEAGHITAAHDYLAKAGAACPHGAADVTDVGAEKVAKAGARHSAADQAHLDSAHEHLGKMGYCGKADDGDEAGKAARANALAKGMSKGDQVHLDTAHDHISKMGVGCGMSKAGARHSKEDLAHLTKAHDHMAAAGADCATASEGAMDGDAAEHAEPADKVAAVDLVKALADKNAVIDGLEKAIRDTAPALKALQERIERIEKQEVPHPSKRTFTIVDKAADDAHDAAERLRKMAKEDPRGLALALITDAQAHPIDVNQVGTR